MARRGRDGDWDDTVWESLVGIWATLRQLSPAAYHNKKIIKNNKDTPPPSPHSLFPSFGRYRLPTALEHSSANRGAVGVVEPTRLPLGFSR